MSPSVSASTAFLVSLAASSVVLLPTRAALRRAGVIDRPNARSSHGVPTIRGAGAAIIAVVVLALLGLALDQPAAGALAGALAALSVVSFIDDLRGLGAPVRFAVHAVSAGIGLFVVHQLGGVVADGVLLVGLAAISWLWVVGYTNAFNFMDGINGLAAMQAIAGAAGTALIASALGVPPAHPAIILAWVIAGAALGFVPHNFPRARVFMGDVGSAPLGFLLAILAVWIGALTGPWVLFWLGLLHANFVLDTAITLLRRAARGDKVWEAHREHFYQRLVRSGQSHTRVTLTQAALQGLVVAALCWATPQTAGLRLATAAVVVVVWLVYFAWAEATFSRVGR